MARIKNRDYNRARDLIIQFYNQNNVVGGRAAQTHPAHGNDGTVPASYGRDLYDQVVADLNLNPGVGAIARRDFLQELEDLLL